MEDLNRMAVFAAVVEHGSMSAAARQLGMTPSAISQHIRQLEAQSGVPLMHRTTRKLTLSDAGQRFYTQCAAMVHAARQARAELDAERDEPVGELRIAAVLGLAAPLGQALAPLLHAYPQLRLQLLLDDAHTDLVAERIDLAIRLGTLPDSTWVARSLAELPWYVCAAPALLQGQPPIQHPQQLQTLPWITRHTSKSPTAELALQHRSTGESTTLHTTSRIICNQQQAVQQLCAEGLGIAKLFSLDVAEPIAQGQLQRLLPDWNCGSLTIWALTPQRNVLPARVRMALAALQGYFSSSASMPSA